MREVKAMPPADTPPQTLWVIWIALLGSVIAYAAIGVYVPISTEAVPSETVHLLTQLFGFLALANIGVVFGLRGVLAKRLPYVTYCIVRWALCESAAIFGLVLHIMGASLTILGAFVTASAFAMVLVRPGESDRESYEAEKSSAS